MGDMLSQAEIDALLNGANIDDEPVETETDLLKENINYLTPEEKDAIGEIGNISMGTSATTLYALLGQKVSITTPRIEENIWNELSKRFSKPYVAVKVEYTTGLKGFNLLIMKESDVKIITDLMMGGDGYGNIQGELTELHLSAISEAMNQMMGSSSTSLSSMFEKRVDISPPQSSLIGNQADIQRIRMDLESSMVMVLFSMKIGDIVDSEIMQIMPYTFAKELALILLDQHNKPAPPIVKQPVTAPPKTIEHIPQQEVPIPMKETSYRQPQQMPTGQQPPPPQRTNPIQENYGQQFGYAQPEYQAPPPQHIDPVNVQPVQFQAFDDVFADFDRNNIGLLMDVPLQVSVELGRTTKKIREILEFGQGSIIELDKLAGEPVDILVNGKSIARGEVVVIDESFGVRITDILHPSKRL